MTVSVSFNAPQAQLDNGSTGVQLAQVILPYSIRNSEDPTKYLGGQMTLFSSDGIKLTDNTKDWERLALAKVKKMVADAEIYVPEQFTEAPEGLPASSAVEAPVSSATDSVASVASSEAMVESSEAVESSVSSEATVASSATEDPIRPATAESVAQ